MPALNKTITLKGLSGDGYTFALYSKETNFNPVKGIYLISRRTDEGKHTFLYIGQTNDLSERLSNHHKQDCFEGGKYNCIGFLNVSKQEDRDYIETDLLKRNKLHCNEMLNS